MSISRSSKVASGGAEAGELYDFCKLKRGTYLDALTKNHDSAGSAVVAQEEESEPRFTSGAVGFSVRGSLGNILWD